MALATRLLRRLLLSSSITQRKSEGRGSGCINAGGVKGAHGDELSEARAQLACKGSIERQRMLTVDARRHASSPLTSERAELGSSG